MCRSQADGVYGGAKYFSDTYRQFTLSIHNTKSTIQPFQTALRKMLPVLSLDFSQVQILFLVFFINFTLEKTQRFVGECAA